MCVMKFIVQSITLRYDKSAIMQSEAMAGRTAPIHEGNDAPNRETAPG